MARASGIKPDGGGDDVFVHYTDVKMEGFVSLKPGQRVNYDAVQDRKGVKATNVTPVA
jgi:CspA family cold shock protein